MISVLGVASAMLVGCNGDDGSECGEGTVERGGKCVPSADACGEGATFDPGTDRCVADRADCPTGTVAMGDECVPDGSVICADGTDFDAETGTCVPGEGACGAGTVLVDGECIGEDEALMPEVFMADEPDDPIYDGTPQVVTPPAIGAERTLGGCITPEDFDGDGELDIDVDYFAFTTSEAGLFRLRADGLGGAAAAFAVLALDEPLVSQGYERIGLNLTGDTSERQVYLPSAGTYALLVFDSRSVDIEGLAGGLSLTRAVGSEDTCYHVTMEGLEIPEPTEVTDGTASGTFGDPTFLSVTATGDTVYQSDLTEESMAVTAAQVLMAGGRTVAAPDLAFSPRVPDGEDLVVVVDHVYDIGLTESEWDLSLSPVEQVPEAGDVTLTHADDETGHYLAFEAEAGDVVHLTVDGGADDLLVVVRRPDTGGGFAPCGTGPGGVVIPCTVAETWYVVEQGGSQLVQVFNNDGVAGTDYTLSLSRSVITPPEVSPGDTADVTLVDGRGFARLDASSLSWSTVGVTGFAGSGFSAADVRLLADEPGPLPSSGLVELSGFTGDFQRIHGPDGGASTLIEIVDPAGFDGDEQVTVSLDEVDHTAIEVTPGTDVDRAGDTSPADGIAGYLLEGEPGAPTTVEVTGTGGADVTLQLLGPDASPLRTADSFGADGTETLSLTMPAHGWVALSVGAGATDGTFDVLVTQEEPVSYSIGAGTTAYGDVCGVGGAVALLDGDDTLSSSFDFSTGFTLFGEEVNGVVVSSNGWLTIDRSHTGFDFVDTSVFPESFPEPGAPVDGVIAPFATDLISTACALELSDRVVVQWEGGPFVFGGSPPPEVEMQVVMWDDGRIELVYGPGHIIDDPDAVVGLEGPVGALSAIPTDAPAPDSSILFTPM